MNILSDKEKIKNSAIVIGNFDGVHLGHRHLLQMSLRISLEHSLIPTVVTFFPHPYTYYNVGKPLITNEKQKQNLIKEIGIINYININFNSDFSNLSPEYFFHEYLINRYDGKIIIVGDNFSFGKDKQGNSDILTELAGKVGVLVEVVKPITKDNIIISSSNIRNFILSGNIPDANSMLGRHYSVCGRIVHGDKLGRTFGYPTANFDLENDLLPPDGVYAGFLYIDRKIYQAMIYIGTRPTINNSGLRKVEANVLDYNGDLYGKHLELNFIANIRKSVKFDCIENLKRQLNKDEIAIRNIFK